MVTQRGEATFVKTRDKQEEKFARFQNRNEAPRRCRTQEKWVRNLSSHKLTEEETDVLGRGLNFAPAMSKVPTKDIVASVEPVLRQHYDPSEANVARAAICNILKKSKPPRANLTFGEKEALKSLRQNEDIVIAKADKGNVTVVMNKEDYEKKAEEILHAAPFQALESDVDTTKATEQKLNDTLKTLLEKKAISKPLYNHLRVSPGCSKPALFYGLPKIHKENVPLRPIVSHTGHALYNTAKYLSRLPLQKFSWAFVFSWESHEILMRKWLSHENFRNLMRIFHEVFRSWEFHFSHEKLFFLMRIEKAHETFPRSREILYPTRGVFEKSSWAFSVAILSASYIFPLPPFSNLIQIIILCSSPQASPSLFPNQ